MQKNWNSILSYYSRRFSCIDDADADCWHSKVDKVYWIYNNGFKTHIICIGNAKSGFGTFGSVSPNASFGSTQGNSLFESLGASNNTMTFSNLAQNQSTAPPANPFSGGFVTYLQTFFILFIFFKWNTFLTCLPNLLLDHHSQVGAKLRSSFSSWR